MKVQFLPNSCNTKTNATNFASRQNPNKPFKPEANPPQNTEKNSNQKTAKALKIGLGIAALAACAFLFLKKHHISSDIFQTTEPQNKRAFIAFLKTPEAQQLKHVVDKQTKQGFLDITGIKNKFRHSNSDYMDPETILKRLETASCVSSLTEKPFLVGKNKHITSGRKFNFVLQVKKGKKYNMVFEVHDYIKGEERNWVMRIYDNDKIKDSRSYLTRIGNFVQNAYNDGFTHIPCGSLGEKFVLGNKVCA